MAAATPFRPKKWHTFQTPLELGRSRIMAADMPFSPAVHRKFHEKFHLGCTPHALSHFFTPLAAHTAPSPHTATPPSRSRHLGKFRVRACCSSRARRFCSRALAHYARLCNGECHYASIALYNDASSAADQAVERGILQALACHAAPGWHIRIHSTHEFVPHQVHCPMRVMEGA